ncbi:MAG TPA: PAS domain S-box protein [Longimicrobiales bacterium]|nr:PAS domain S-box protein [Longimicrobiales bacterium]
MDITVGDGAWYRGLIEHSLDKVAVVSADGTILFESAGVTRLLGWRPEELVGTAMVDLIHPEDLATAVSVMGEALASPGEAYRLDARLRHRDGTWRHFESLGHARAGAGGLEIVVNSRDITDRREAEERARTSDQLFRTLADSSPDGFMLFHPVRDEAGQIVDFEWVYTNPAATAVVARSHDQLLGRRLRVEMPGTVPSRLFDAWVAVVETGEPWTSEFHYPFDGLDRVFRSQAVKVNDGFGVTFSDVTESHRIRDELREREARFRALTEQIPQLVWSARDDGFHDFFNQRWYDYTGMEPDSGHCWTWEAYVHPDDYGAARAGWLAAMSTGEAFETECRLRGAADGSYRWFICRALPLRDDAGTIHRWFGTCTDVHDERQVELELRQAQKMEAIGQLAGGVAHDFNNLLTVITSYSEVLLADLPENAPARTDVEEIRRAAGRASTLTRQLLAFSRRQVLQPRDLDLNHVVADMEKLLRRVIGETIALECRPGTDVGHVRADPGQIEQVIINLAVNARDAMPGGGSVVLTTSRRRTAGGDYAVLSVTDTGTGMDELTVQHIFEPFFTTKPEGQGTGLGLATVHGIVTQSGGRVEVDSAPGRGSTFHVLLPATQPTEPMVTAPPATTHETPTGGGSILVVEDEEAVRSIARRSLVRHGYQVYEASNGREALAMLDDGAAGVDLIISDLVMPVMGGGELARRLRGRESAPPMLFMSGYAEKDAVPGNELDAGALLLEKPFTMQQLLRAVSRALGQA